MKLEQQVCSLEFAKRLRKLGVEQESYFYWIYTNQPLANGSRNEVVAGNTLGDSHWELGGEADTYSAFTVAELGEMIVGKIQVERYNDGKWTMFWMSYPMLEYSKNAQVKAETEVDALAKMVIHLLENKLITLP